MVKMLDDSPRARTEAIEKRVENLIKAGSWKEAKRVMGVAVRTAQRGESLVLAKEVKGRYEDISAGKNPYVAQGYSQALYSSAFVAFALGSLLLVGNITGNVVGLGQTGSIIGAVLVALGIVVAFVLVKKRAVF